jgi:hypothetical protein
MDYGKLVIPVRFEVFTAVTMKNAVFWGVAPPSHAGSSLADFSTLKMEAIRSFETSVQSTTSTRRHTSEDGILLVIPVSITHANASKRLG